MDIPTDSDNLDRPEYYQYARMVHDHVLTQRRNFRPFDGTAILPRQLEVHVPNGTERVCNLHCKHCQGNKVDQPMELYDEALLKLISSLAGRIPLFVFSGAYVEPMLNERLIDFIRAAKLTGSQFGLHTHGGLFEDLEAKLAFVSQLCELADGDDYVTISLDAGTGQSYSKTKRVHPSAYDKVARGLDLLVHARTKHGAGPKLRLTYLFNKWNSSSQEISAAVSIARSLQVDSLRFSVPYAPYGTSYEATIQYKNNHENILYADVVGRVGNFLSSSVDEKPYICLLHPRYQDVEERFVQHCFYGYFQITIGADGNVYRCSSTASPSFPEHSLGRMPSTASELIALVHRNQDDRFDPLQRCKPCGARCNRAAIDVNQSFELQWFTEHGDAT